jgi:hypothetical protein
MPMLIPLDTFKTRLIVAVSCAGSRGDPFHNCIRHRRQQVRSYNVGQHSREARAGHHDPDLAATSAVIRQASKVTASESRQFSFARALTQLRIDLLL